MGARRRLIVALLASGLSACAYLRGPRAPLGPDRAQPSRDRLDHGDYRGAVDAVNALLIKERLTPHEQERAYLTLGQGYEWLNELEKALSTYQVAVQLFPKNKGLTLALAHLLHRTGLDDRARPFFERVLKMDPKNSAAHQGLAESYRSLGLLEEAADHYRIALEGSVPGPAEVWRDFAFTLAEKRDLAGAERAIQKAIALAPGADDLLTRAVLQRRQGESEAAYASLKDAAVLSPGRRDILLRRTFWLVKDGRLDEAEEEARRLPAGDPLASLALSVAALKRGDRAEAARFLQAAQSGSPLVADTAKSLLQQLKVTQ